MKAIRCFEYGGPEVLQLVEMEIPSPKPGEVLVRVRAASVSAEDPKMRAFEHYDIVFDTVGRTTFGEVRALLTRGGRYLVTVFSVADMFRMLWTSLRGAKRMIGGASNFHWRPEDLELVCGLVDRGQWVSVVDRVYPWHEVALAHRYVEGGHKRGNVVLRVGEEAS